MTFDGPAGLIVRAEADWFEGEDADRECRGVPVEVSVAGEPVGSFVYTVSESARGEIVDRLEPEAAERIVAALGPAARLTKRVRP
jgi:hypothetical protein